jgi:predicted  nucleic acid-binding Zn-ribbon protein
MPPGFRVVAIVAAYNEADIIAQVAADLIAQGIDVYVLDDGSTDGTAAAVEPLVGRGVIAVEPLRARTAVEGDRFDWTRILERKTALAREIDADWFIHHDADEFRESPWAGVPLRDAIARVDAAGFNAIDFASFDFWPTHDRFRPGDDVRAAFTHVAERAPYDRVQVRAWKRTSAAVNLASSGGHDAQFAGRRVFPLRFISRHYPIRGQAHGMRKVMQERVGRFRDEERARGWHVQYDALQHTPSFVRDPAALTPYDGDDVRLMLSLRHRGVEALEDALADARCAADAHQRQLDDLRAAYERLHDVCEAQRRDLGAHRAELERHRGELENRTRDVETHRRELDRHRSEIAADRRDIAARDHAVARTTAELLATRAELDRCAGWARSLERDVTHARDARSATDAALSAARSDLAARAREVDAVRALASNQAQVIDNLNTAVDARTLRVSEMERSLSWRLTAPARALVRALRGR